MIAKIKNKEVLRIEFDETSMAIIYYIGTVDFTKQFAYNLFEVTEGGMSSSQCILTLGILQDRMDELLKNCKDLETISNIKAYLKFK